MWVSDGKMAVEDVGMPEAIEGWSLIKVSRSGICGSEVAAFQGLNELRKPPLIMGHEFSGTVESAASDDMEELTGRMVAVNPMVTCGKCYYCRSGLRNLCPDRQIVGAAFPGSFGEYVHVPPGSCYPVGDATAGALAEPLATALRAVGKCNIGVGDGAIVFGMGIIGLFLLRLLKRMGISKCVAADINEARLSTAKQLGASLTVDMREKDAAGYVADYFGSGADFSFDAVGIAATRSGCIMATRRGGKAVFVGNHEKDTGIDGNTIVRGEISVEGSYAYTDNEFARAVELAQSGFMGPSAPWLRVCGIEEGPDIFERLSTNRISESKVIMHF